MSSRKLADITPQYRSHKIVRAAKVYAVSAECDGVRAVDVEVDPALNMSIWREVLPASTFARFVPSNGDYLVIYEDGYISFSPAKAFEEGYRIVEQEAAVSPELVEKVARKVCEIEGLDPDALTFNMVPMRVPGIDAHYLPEAAKPLWTRFTPIAWAALNAVKGH